MKIDFKEIMDWSEFEDLVADIFRTMASQKDNQLIDVNVEPSGEGSDGGRDILLTFRINDSIRVYERKWIVQCKYYKKSVGKQHIANVNIPSLIHEYGAEGYLLVCLNKASSKVTEMFENLRKNCKFRYSYEIWGKSVLTTNLLVMPNLLMKYFPEYSKKIDKIDKTIGI